MAYKNTDIVNTCQSDNIRRIKKMMIDAGVTGSDIARSVNVDNTTIYHTISGRRKSLRMRSAIAEALGKSVSELWC